MKLKMHEKLRVECVYRRTTKLVNQNKSIDVHSSNDCLSFDECVVEINRLLRNGWRMVEDCKNIELKSSVVNQQYYIIEYVSVN